MSSAVFTKTRIASLDQFRGYTVAGMCLVNFLAPFASVPALLKHNESWFSYADSIMPSFFFVVGYSFRLTYLRRRVSTTRLQTAKAYLRRSLVLFGLAFVIYALTADWSRWAETGKMPAEYDSARRMPPATKSFQLLVDRAAQTSPNPATADPTSQTVLESAQRMGLLIVSAEPRGSAVNGDSATAQDALRVAQEEATPFLRAASERVRAWGALGGTGQLLVHLRIQAGRLFKAELWETLAMIAAAQLLVLPWIGFRPLIRLAVLIAYGLTHLVLCAWFNWDFVYGVNNNWMSRLWMTGDCRSWDGGVFGPLCWSVAILAGTLAYDLPRNPTSGGISAWRLFLFGAGFMIFGFALSCLSRLYDLNGLELAAIRARHLRQSAEQAWLDSLIGLYEQRLASLESSRRDVAVDPRRVAADVVVLQARIAVLQDQRAAYPDLNLAPNPFMPTRSEARNRSLGDWLADPPFVATPQDDGQSVPGPVLEHRLWNYWMLGKRMPTLSFMTLASGFACVLYSLFVVGCDRIGMKLGVFRTFGTNALVAYFVHGMLTLALWPFISKTAGLPTALAAFAVFFTITWLLVRQLEKRGIYLKL